MLARIARAAERTNEVIAGTLIASRYGASALMIATGLGRRAAVVAAGGLCRRSVRVTLTPPRDKAAEGRGAHGNLCPGARGLARRLVLAARDKALDRARSRGVRANPYRRRRAGASADAGDRPSH